jgi:hypothetical protein
VGKPLEELCGHNISQYGNSSRHCLSVPSYFLQSKIQVYKQSCFKCHRMILQSKLNNTCLDSYPSKWNVAFEFKLFLIWWWERCLFFNLIDLRSSLDQAEKTIMKGEKKHTLCFLIYKNVLTKIRRFMLLIFHSCSSEKFMVQVTL